MPAGCREALEWFVGNHGLYLGSTRGLFLSDFTEEHEASLEACIINLRSRGFNPLVISGESLYKQAEYLFDQSLLGAQFGRPLASKVELDLTGADVVIATDLGAPESEKQLWYLYNHLIYPRVQSGKAMIVTTALAYEEFIRYGADCADAEFGGRTIRWEKLLWLIESSMINLDLFRLMRQEGLPPMLKAEYYLWMSLRERGLNPVPQQVLGDYMLDLAMVEREQRLNIEVDGLTSVGGYDRQAEDAKRHFVMLTDGWQILRFTTAEVLNNHSGCAEVVEDVWRGGRKKLPVGRLMTGQNVAHMPELPVDDEVQLAAITHGGGPAAVIGGAGTGKTTCIAQRVIYLLSQQVSPESILVIAHSAETLQSVKQALEAALDKQTLQRLHLWAWHDLGLKVLKENLAQVKRKAPLKVEANPQKIIQRILAKHKKELDQTTLELSTGLDEFAVAATIAMYKANLVSPKHVKERARDNIESLIARVYQSYEDQLQRANRIDREDMVAAAVQLLLDRPDVRARYQSHFDFVLVDDYQDATAAQDLMARLFASPQDNLYLVGDEDECIFESKGASPKLLMDISHRLPQTRCYTLERNWRSHPAIVDHARQLISQLGRRRFPKELHSAWSAPSASAIVGPHRLQTDRDECNWLADEVQILLDSGRSPADIAVLYRYHRYGPLVEEALAARGVRCLASRPDAGLVPDESEDMLAFLRLVMDPDGPKAKESFERVCQLRTKEVDPKLSQTIAGFAEANNLSYLKALEIYSEATADQSCRDLEQLVRIIRTMHQEGLPPAETIALIKRTQRLGDYYKSVNVPPGVVYEPLRRLNAMEEEARKFQTVAEFVKSQTALRQQGSKAGGDAEAGVHVLSMHEAQGMEFPVVFMVGLAQGLFPADTASDLEEERRLCYVGLTRAKELIYLSMPATFNNLALEPSSFLIEARLMPAPSACDPAAYQQAFIHEQPASPPAPPEPAVAPSRTDSQPAVRQPAAPPELPPAAAPVGPIVAPAVFAAPSVVPHAGLPTQPPDHAPAAPLPPQAAAAEMAAGAQAGSASAYDDQPQAFQPAAPAEPAAFHGGGLPQCSQCFAPLEVGARFCGDCGYRLPARIPSCALCGSPLEPAAKFCGECGTPAAGQPGGAGQALPVDQKPDQHGWMVKLLKFLEPD